MTNWPAALAPGTSIDLPPQRIDTLRAYAYAKGMKNVAGYPSGAPERGEIESADRVADVVDPGQVRVQYVAYLDGGAGSGLLLEARMLKAEARIGDFSALTNPRQGRALAWLAGQFGRDAFAARDAHDSVVRIGAAAVPMLTGIVTNSAAPGFARMWTTTALADVGGAPAAATLKMCLADPSPAVRNVAAYHGLKLHDDAFDAALGDAARTGADPTITAWAILGYLKFRKDVPAALLSVAVENKDRRARAAVLDTIVGANPDASHLPLLRKLAADEDERIRKKALDAINRIQPAPSRGNP